MNDDSFSRWHPARGEFMSATHYKVDVEDIRFVLFDQLEIHTALKDFPRYSGFDRDIYEATLDEARRIAEDVLGPANRPSDRQGIKLDGEGNVTTPDVYKECWKVTSEGGWFGVASSTESGGTGLPHVIHVLSNEVFSGACMAFTMYMGLTAGVANLLAHFGPEGKKFEYSRKLFSGEWGGTMCLTEAGAGTAVGDNRCKAIRTDVPGEYLLEGEKIFISGGDQDLTSNIIHLVLARTPDAPNGTKGLSLFIVPKFHVNPDLSLGERNGAYVVGVEHKMGIHASATTVLSLGAKGPCKGTLIGKEGDGMEIMFTLMNEARIGVGIQGVALAAAAHGCAVSYAKERIQGTSIANMRDPNAVRVPIIDHPDVRRNLMNQKVNVELMRSFVYRLAQRLDVADNSPDPAVRERVIGQVELLVPVLKAYCTDVGFQVTVDALQTFGGYGYTAEYPVEQYVRDAKITSIYEGTNGVQAMDLLGRKMRMKGGALFMEWMQDVQGDLAAAAFDGFGEQAEAVNKALNELGAAAMHLGALGMQKKLDAAMLQAYPFLQMMGTVALGIEAIHQARVARRLIAERGETPHLAGKLLNLDWYVKVTLPMATALGKAVQSGAEAPLDPRLFS
jgi:alkylation response protein AidB-like acyl-CoA dehydrogenase